MSAVPDGRRDRRYRLRRSDARGDRRRMLLSSIVWAVLACCRSALSSAPQCGPWCWKAGTAQVVDHRSRLVLVVLVTSLVMIGIDRPLGAGLFRVRPAGRRARGLRPTRLRGRSPLEVSGPVQHTQHRRAVLFLNPKSGSGDRPVRPRGRGQGPRVETSCWSATTTSPLAEAAADGAEVLGRPAATAPRPTWRPWRWRTGCPSSASPPAPATTRSTSTSTGPIQAGARRACPGVERRRPRPGGRPLLREQRRSGSTPRRRRPRVPRGSDEGRGHDHP